MKREDALKDYREQVSPLLEQGSHELEQVLSSEPEAGERILKAVDTLCKKTVQYQKNGKKGIVQYLQISLITAQMWEDRFPLLLGLYDNRYFLDREPVEITYSADWMFSPLTDLRKKLYEKTMVYMGKVEKLDADRLIMDLAVDFFRKSADEFRVKFMNLDCTEAAAALIKEPVFTVKWGELRGKSGIIFRSDSRNKTQTEFEQIYSSEEQETWRQRVFDCWERVGFQGVKLMDKGFLYPSFRYSQFHQCVFGGCVIAGGNFFQSELIRCAFHSGILQKCNFKQANLSDVHFIDCDLSNSDFRGADIKETLFYGSNLDHTVFSRSALPGLHLEPFQLQQITIGDD